MSDQKTVVVHKGMSPMSVLLIGLTLILAAGKLFAVTPDLTELSWWYIVPIPFLPLIAVALVGLALFAVAYIYGFVRGFLGVK